MAAGDPSLQMALGSVNSIFKSGRPVPVQRLCSPLHIGAGGEGRAGVQKLSVKAGSVGEEEITDPVQAVNAIADKRIVNRTNGDPINVFRLFFRFILRPVTK